MIKFKSLNDYKNVFLTSDSHYSHKNITRGTSDWTNSQRTRDFNTVEEMNQALIDGLKIVKENDVLIHCGDVAFAGKEQVEEYVSHCKGDIILCYGNHDHNVIKHEYLQNLFADTAHMHYLQFKGQKMLCAHYPMIVWHQSHKGARLAFGHVHGTNPGVGISQDVGVDVAYKLFGEYRPFTFKEFIKLTDAKDINFDSHHSPNTN